MFLVIEHYNDNGFLQLPEAFLWHSFLQLSEGLAYLHYGFDSRSQRKPSDWASVIRKLCFRTHPYPLSPVSGSGHELSDGFRECHNVQTYLSSQPLSKEKFTDTGLLQMVISSLKTSSLDLQIEMLHTL